MTFQRLHTIGHAHSFPITPQGHSPHYSFVPKLQLFSCHQNRHKKSCVFSPAGPDGYPGRGGQQCRLSLPEATAAQCSAAEGSTQSSASTRFPPGMRGKQRELSSSLHRCTDNSGDSSHGDTHVTAVTRGTVQCDRLQTRSPGSVSQNPVEALRGGESPGEPMCLSVLSRGFSLGTPRTAQPAVPGLQHLLFEGDTVDGKLLHRCLPDSHLSDHLLHFWALALKQQLDPAQKNPQANTYPQLMNHKHTWERHKSPASPSRGWRRLSFSCRHSGCHGRRHTAPSSQAGLFTGEKQHCLD